MSSKSDFQSVIIYGAGRGGRVVKEILEMQNCKILGFVDDEVRLKGTEKFGLQVLGGFETLLDLKSSGRNVKVVISFAASNLMKQRELLFHKLKSEGFSFANAIHPMSYISPSVEIGVNNVISPGSVIEAGTKVGDNNRICINVSIDHDCSIGNTNLIGANAYIGSCSIVENNCILEPFSNIRPFSKISSSART